MCSFPPKQTTGRLQLNIPEIYFVTPSRSYSTCGLESEIQLQFSKTGKTLNITFPILFDVLHVVPLSGFCPLTGERGLITLSVGLHYSSHCQSCNATCQNGALRCHFYVAQQHFTQLWTHGKCVFVIVWLCTGISLRLFCC